MRGTKPKLQSDPEALGEMPAPIWLSPEARDEWDRVMPILAERRILTEADLGSLESYCMVVGQVRKMERHLQQYGYVLDVDGTLKRNPQLASSLTP